MGAPLLVRHKQGNGRQTFATQPSINQSQGCLKHRTSTPVPWIFNAANALSQVSFLEQVESQQTICTPSNALLKNQTSRSNARTV